MERSSDRYLSVSAKDGELRSLIKELAGSIAVLAIADSTSKFSKGDYRPTKRPRSGFARKWDFKYVRDAARS